MEGARDMAELIQGWSQVWAVPEGPRGRVRGVRTRGRRTLSQSWRREGTALCPHGIFLGPLVPLAAVSHQSLRSEPTLGTTFSLYSHMPGHVMHTWNSPCPKPAGCQLTSFNWPILSHFPRPASPFPGTQASPHCSCLHPLTCPHMTWKVSKTVTTNGVPSLCHHLH